jgi:hypothetical protein
MHKLGYTPRQECRLCRYDKESSVHIVCHRPVLACKTYTIWGSMFLKPEDRQNVWASSLLSLVADAGILTSQTAEEIQWNNAHLGIAIFSTSTTTISVSPELVLIPCRYL